MCRKSIEMATSVGDSFATCECCSKECEAIRYGDPMERLPNDVPEQCHGCKMRESKQKKNNSTVLENKQ